MYVYNKVLETNFFIILSQMEFQSAYGPGARNMLMTP